MSRSRSPSLALSMSDFNSRFGVGILFIFVGIASWMIHKKNVQMAGGNEMIC